METKRRALVLADESARHPFRRSLPPYLRKQAPASLARRRWRRLDSRDWRGFFNSYCAAFLAVSVFIS